MAVAAKARRADPADAARKRQKRRVPRRKPPRPGHLVHADLRRLADAGAELDSACTLRRVGRLARALIHSRWALKFVVRRRICRIKDLLTPTNPTSQRFLQK